MRSKVFAILMFVLLPIIFILSGCSLLAEKYTLTAIASEKGTYTLSHEVAKEGEDVTITAIADEGYKFDYAMVNNKKITTTKFYMPDENATVKVYFIPITYYIIYVKDDTMLFQRPQNKEFTVEDEVTSLGVLEKNGYTFEGWYTDSTFTNPIEKIEKGTTESITLYPKFDLDSYSITYHIDRDTINENNPTTFTILDADKTLINPTKEGYTFKGWYNNENFTGDKITKISSGTFGNVNLYPKFITNKRDNNGFKLIETQLDFDTLFIEEFDQEEKYKLCTDIDMGERIWNPRDFRGEFDGSNHTIFNINIEVSKYNSAINVGMFRELDNATVKNLKISYNINVDLNTDVSSYGIGGIAGRVSSNLSVNKISNIQVLTGSKIQAKCTKGLIIGGIIGIANDKTTIEDCSIKNLSIEVENAVGITNVGGISGRYGQLNKCSVSLENTDFIIYNTTQLSYATVNLAGIMAEGDDSAISNSYFSQKGTSKLKIHQVGSNSENLIAGIIADATTNTTIDCCYAQIREFEFSKKSTTKNSKIYIAGLACGGSVSNSFVARARQTGKANDDYNFNTTQDGEYYTAYNDLNNTYNFAYICFSQEVPNTYVEYADFFHNESLLPTSKIYDYTRLYNNDLRQSIAYINSVLVSSWGTTNWQYINQNYPPILK